MQPFFLLNELTDIIPAAICYASHLPLKSGADALQVNWFELITTDVSGKTTYRNAWVSSHSMNENNVVQLAQYCQNCSGIWVIDWR